MKLNNKFVYGFGSGLLLVIVFTIILIIGTGQVSNFGKDIGKDITPIVDKYAELSYNKMDKTQFKTRRNKIVEVMTSSTMSFADLSTNKNLNEGFKEVKDTIKYLQATNLCGARPDQGLKQYFIDVLNGNCLN